MVLVKCDCKNPFQDEKYGYGVRVHNLCNGGKMEATSGVQQARCTVCGKEKNVRGF